MFKMVRIEKFDRAFYPELISWVKSAEALMQFAGPAFIFPLTNEQLDSSLKDENRYAFRFVQEDTNLSVGYGEIYRNDSTAFLGRIII